MKTSTKPDDANNASSFSTHSGGNEIEGPVWGAFLDLNLESRIIALLFPWFLLRQRGKPGRTHRKPIEREKIHRKLVENRKKTIENEWKSHRKPQEHHGKLNMHPCNLQKRPMDECGWVWLNLFLLLQTTSMWQLWMSGWDECGWVVLVSTAWFLVKGGFGYCTAWFLVKSGSGYCANPRESHEFVRQRAAVWDHLSLKSARSEISLVWNHQEHHKLSKVSASQSESRNQKQCH